MYAPLPLRSRSRIVIAKERRHSVRPRTEFSRLAPPFNRRLPFFFFFCCFSSFYCPGDAAAVRSWDAIFHRGDSSMKGDGGEGEEKREIINRRRPCVGISWWWLSVASFFFRVFFWSWAVEGRPWDRSLCVVRLKGTWVGINLRKILLPMSKNEERLQSKEMSNTEKNKCRCCKKSEKKQKLKLENAENG